MIALQIVLVHEAGLGVFDEAEYSIRGWQEYFGSI
jgi:hypothetical protein